MGFWVFVEDVFREGGKLEWKRGGGEDEDLGLRLREVKFREKVSRLRTFDSTVVIEGISQWFRNGGGVAMGRGIGSDFEKNN
ncbi:hypothetical protein FCV25MIE_12801 [Fagus crenata]